MTLMEATQPSQAASSLGMTERPLSADAQASIVRYLHSGERVAALLDVGSKVCVGLIGLILVAWAAGILPGAVQLFR
jgi:hypothetical protein